MPLEIPPCLPPGVTVQTRDSKFQNWNGEYGYYQRAETRLPTYKTDNMTSMVYKLEDQRASHGICSTMRLANRANVIRPEGAREEDAARPLSLKRTVAHQCYIDFKGISSKYDCDNDTINKFELAFNQYSSKGNYDGDDCYCRMSNIKDILINVLGENIPQFIEEKFLKLCKRAEVSSRLYWADFKNIIPNAMIASQADCTVKRELPPLVMLMTKPRLTDPDLGPMAIVKSCYGDTFGPTFKELTTNPYSKTPKSDYSKFLVKDPTKYNQEDLVLKPKSILNPANEDLCAGTPKGSQQIPGYTGHMPRNLRNPRKQNHSSGDSLHPVVNALRMTKKGGSNVLGYAGHVPWHADSERERISGCDPRTSTGAAFGSERLPL